MCISTALAEITSRCAMTVLAWPSAISASSCRSRPVSAARALSRRFAASSWAMTWVEHRHAAGNPVQASRNSSTLATRFLSR